MQKLGSRKPKGCFITANLIYFRCTCLVSCHGVGRNDFCDLHSGASLAIKCNCSKSPATLIIEQLAYRKAGTFALLCHLGGISKFEYTQM